MNRTKLEPPPIRSLRRLERAANGDYSVSRIVLAVYDLVLGGWPDRRCPNYEVRVGVIASLPAAERDAARQVLTWGARKHIVLNELLASRTRVTGQLRRLWTKSPYGRRRLRIAREIRLLYPPRKPTTSNTSERPELLEMLQTEVGRPLGPDTIRQVSAFQPSQIEIRAQGDAWYASVTKGAVYIQLGADGFTIEQIQLGAVCEQVTPSATVHGFLEDFFETGSEGIVWSVLDDDARGYDALHTIEEGDHLTITDQLGRRLWAGVIRCDWRAGWRRYPMNPKYGQPCALGYWVHWTQSGFTADTWARFFIRPQYDRLRGILKKHQHSVTKARR